MNKFVSRGVEQVRTIYLNQYFPINFPLKLGMRIIQECILYSNFYGMQTVLAQHCEVENERYNNDRDEPADSVRMAKFSLRTSFRIVKILLTAVMTGHGKTSLGARCLSRNCSQDTTPDI